MSTHNICFRQVIRKLFTWYSLLSRSMDLEQNTELHLGLHWKHLLDTSSRCQMRLFKFYENGKEKP